MKFPFLPSQSLIDLSNEALAKYYPQGLNST